MRLTLLLLLALICVAWAEPADLVVRGDIYTVDRARSWAKALAIRDGKFVYVGEAEGLADWIGPKTEVLELSEQMVLPGLHDSHVHPAAGGYETLLCDLNTCETLEQIEEVIKAYAAAHSNDPTLLGGGWDMTLFPTGQPTKEQLDKLVPDKPAFLTSADAHTAWVNSKALELAGITADTPDPPAGKIVRDGNGQPTGLLREEAIRLVSSKILTITVDNFKEGALVALKQANSLGITSVMEANANEDILKAYHQLEKEGRLTARIVACLETSADKGPEQVRDMARQRQLYEGQLMRPTAAKIFADGVVEGHTAALLEPYLDSGDTGLAIRTTEALNTLLEALDAEQFQVHIHAIGDRAVRESLDAIQRANKLHGRRDARHHLAHIQMIDEADIPRFRQLGVLANIQPLWAYRDKYIRDLTEPVLGPKRSDRLYPFGELHASGAVIVAGSDWTVSSMNPFEAMQVGVTRSSYKEDEPSWLPEQRLTLPTLVAAYTINGAYGLHQEDTTGSIEVGKAADMIVIDRNIFAIEPTELKNVIVERTYLGGRLVYQK